MRVHYEILNQKGTPAFYSDTYTNRPSYGFAGRVFISTDTGQIFEDTGSAWSLIADAGVGGGTLGSVCANGNSTSAGIIITAGGLSSNSITNTSLTAGSILFAGTGGLESQSNATFFWDNTNKRLGIGNASPGAPLDIHGTGTNAHFNGTGTNNAYLQFQNAGTNKWRIGNTYSSGANTFDIYNNTLSAKAISINSTDNTTIFTYDLNTKSTLTTDGGIKLNITATIEPPAGYNAICGITNGILIVTNLAAGGGFLNFPTSSTPTYTFPNATGTLALTSNLSSYLPLTGGTLTGQLYINPTNTGTIGLDVASDNVRFRSDNLEGNKRQLLITMGSGTLVQLTAQGYGANYGTDLAFYTATTGGVNSSPAIYITGTNNRIGIKTGTPSYDLDVAGTGNFSSELLLTSGQLAFSPNGGAPSTNVGFRYTGTFYVYPGTNGFNIRKNDNSGNIFVVNDNGTATIGNSSTSAALTLYGDNGAGESYLKFNADSNVTKAQILGTKNGGSGGMLYLSTLVAGTLTNGIIINQLGKILFGNGLTTDFSAGHLCIQTDQTTENAIAIKNTSGANNGNYIVFVNSSGGGSGSITQTGATTVLYVATSDYRLKDNILPIENAIDRILKIKPVTYNWKNTNNEIGEGFIAHELQEIVPLAVIGIKDEMNDDGTIKAQGIDYGKLTPLLVKAIQELNEKLVRNNIN
jgi:hypothetical protein